MDYHHDLIVSFCEWWDLASVGSIREYGVIARHFQVSADLHADY